MHEEIFMNTIIKILKFIALNIILFFAGLIFFSAIGIQIDVHFKGYVVLYSVFIILPMFIFLLNSLKSK